MPDDRKFEELEVVVADPHTKRFAAAHAAGAELARTLPWQPNTEVSTVFGQRAKALRRSMGVVFSALEAPGENLPDDARGLRDHVRMLQGDLRGLKDAARTVRRIRHVRDRHEEIVPRVLAVAEGYLTAVAWRFDEDSFVTFCEGFQSVTVLDLKELWAVVPALKMILLEQLTLRAKGWKRREAEPEPTTGTIAKSLVSIGHTGWKYLLEPLIMMDTILSEDPAGAYGKMDYDSRDMYRTRLAKIAAGSNKNEMDV